MKNKLITKTLSLIFSALIIFSCAACGQNKEESEKIEIKLSEKSKPQTEESSQPEESIVDPESFEVIAKLDKLPDFITTNKTLYSKMLENMIKLYYYGICSGRITSESYKPRISNDVIPSENATSEERKKAAGYCTVGGALEFYGCDKKNYMKYYDLYNGCLPYFCFSRDGNIYLASEVSADNIINLTSFNQTLINIFRYGNIDNIKNDVIKHAAKEMDSAVKTYYEGIRNGSINKSSFTPVRTSDKLPDESSSKAECEEMARHATIGGALEYAELYSQLNTYTDSLGFNKKTDVFTLPDLIGTDTVPISSVNAEIGSFYE